jgi:hypothetical protein
MDYALVKDEGESFEDALAKANCMEFSRSGGTYSSTHYMMLAWDRARRILLEDEGSEVRDDTLRT